METRHNVQNVYEKIEKGETPKDQIFKELESNRGGPGFTREGELIGAAKEAHEAKMAKERGEKPADSSEGLHGAAKQQHEAKMAREGQQR